MSKLSKALKIPNIEMSDYWKWSQNAERGRHKRLFDSFHRATKALDDAEEEFGGIWLQKNVDMPSFEEGHSRWQRRLNVLSLKVVARRMRILKAYQRDKRD